MQCSNAAHINNYEKLAQGLPGHQIRSNLLLSLNHATVEGLKRTVLYTAFSGKVTTKEVIATLQVEVLNASSFPPWRQAVVDAE